MILVTGFGPFSWLEENPSQLVVEAISERWRKAGQGDLASEVLPTEYRRAGTRICELINEFQPHAVLLLGVAVGEAGIRLERVAVNLDDCPEADNSGEVRRQAVIESFGPSTYLSTLPLDALECALRTLRIPVCVSGDAGCFVCNHVFFVARHYVEEIGLQCACGLIHVPLHREYFRVKNTLERSLPLGSIIAGIEGCIGVVT